MSFRSRSSWMVRTVFLIAALTILASGQGRMNDKDVESTMQNLKEDAKRFRSSFNSAVSKSTIRKTSQEKDAKALAERFQKQTETMLNAFKSKKKAEQELSSTMATADQIDKFLAATPLNDATTSQWAKVKTELATLSKEFEVQPAAAK